MNDKNFVYDFSKYQLVKLNKWMKIQDKKVAEKQGDKYSMSIAYYGASGGGYTYCFTPTGLGTVVKVRNGLTKEEIDLTDYDKW